MLGEAQLRGLGEEGVTLLTTTALTLFGIGRRVPFTDGGGVFRDRSRAYKRHRSNELCVVRRRAQSLHCAAHNSPGSALFPQAAQRRLPAAKRFPQRAQARASLISCPLLSQRHHFRPAQAAPHARLLRIAVATIGIAIGATTAIFSIVDSVLLRPLPYTDPSRLVFVESLFAAGNSMDMSPPDLIDYRNLSHSFTGLTAVQGGGSSTLRRPGLPGVRLNRARVGADFFSLLGVTPERGRGSHERRRRGERHQGRGALRPRVAALFRRRPRHRRHIDHAERCAVPGRGHRAGPVHVPGQARRVDPCRVAQLRGRRPRARGARDVGVARLRPGATVASARRDIQAVAARIAHDFPHADAKIGAYLAPLGEQLVGDVRPALWSLLGAVALVLLIACANVANLSLVRGASRSTEIAVRTALGAARWQLIRQLVTESLLISLAGALIGVLLAAWAVDLVVSFGPHGLPRLSEIAVNGGDARLRGIAGHCRTAFVRSAAGVSRDARRRVALAAPTGSAARARGTTRTRSLLIISETALAMMLLVGAGLLIRSFERLTHVDPGFRPDHLYVFDIALSGNKYNDDAPSILYADEVSGVWRRSRGRSTSPWPPAVR